MSLQTTTSTLPYVLVDLNEYESLKKENFMGNKIQYKLIIDQNDFIIEELKRENSELHQKLEQLELSHVQLKDDYNQLKEEYMYDKLSHKITVVLQDLNANMKLEQVLPDPFNTSMLNLRYSRNDNSHYIKTTDTEDAIVYKKQLI